MPTTILTAIYDYYDSLKPTLTQEGVGEVNWVCVTDSQKEYDDQWTDDTNGWNVVYEPRPELHPNLAAKRAKMRPWEYAPEDHNIIWLDASFRVKSPFLVHDMLALTTDNPIAQFVHPWRDCIYDEAVESLNLLKYEGQPCDAQVAHYREFGHPEHWGLWATGCSIRRPTEELRLFGNHWHDECLRWTYQDQISEPHVLRLHGLRPVSIPGTHFANPWVTYEASGRH